MTVSPTEGLEEGAGGPGVCPPGTSNDRARLQPLPAQKTWREFPLPET